MEQELAGNQTAYLIATGGSVRVAEELYPNDPSPKAITIYAAAEPKRRGEATEAEFIARAAGYGFRIAKPWGDSDPYDVLIGMGQGFWRVQVKRASIQAYGQYMTQTAGHSKRCYTKDVIDFIAAHIVAENIWYIVPIEAFQGLTGLHFNPKVGNRNKYEKYREAWCLLACPPKARGWQDIPVLCRGKDLSVRCAVCPNRGTDGSCGTDTPVRRR